MREPYNPGELTNGPKLVLQLMLQKKITSYHRHFIANRFATYVGHLWCINDFPLSILFLKHRFFMFINAYIHIYHIQMSKDIVCTFAGYKCNGSILHNKNKVPE